jgi:hypothetical protein
VPPRAIGVLEPQFECPGNAWLARDLLKEVLHSFLIVGVHGDEAVRPDYIFGLVA